MSSAQRTWSPFCPQTSQVTASFLHTCSLQLKLTVSDYGFGCRPAVFAPLLGRGIFTQEGAAWKHSRELLRKQFVRAQYQQLDHAFAEHVENLIMCMPASGTVDLQPLFFNLTLDTATALLFGRSVYSLRAGVDQAAENKEFAHSFDIAQEGLAKRFRLAPFHFLYSPPAFRKACRNVHRFVEQYIQERDIAPGQIGSADKDSTSGSWFIDQIAAESQSETEIRDQLLNILLAGRDTTACCLSWALSVYATHIRTFASLLTLSSVDCLSDIQRLCADFARKLHQSWVPQIA